MPCSAFLVQPEEGKLNNKKCYKTKYIYIYKVFILLILIIMDNRFMYFSNTILVQQIIIFII